MFPDPPEDGHRTVFCQDCAKWRHPRHACARDPGHDTASLPVLRLRRDGPLARSSLEDSDSGMNPETRGQNQISKFNPSGHPAGTYSTFGTTSAVYYLADEHDPAAVIEQWLAVNEETLSGRGLTTENITRALSTSRFKNAWRDLRTDRDFDVLGTPDHADRGGDHSSDTECPYCGETVKTLPGHLPCDGS
jgi:hypothetical protein